MILSVGDYYIDTKNVVMVLEIDHLTVTKRGREMFSGNTRERVIATHENSLPLSAIVVNDYGENTIYLTPFAPQTLLKHIGAKKESDGYYIWL